MQRSKISSSFTSALPSLTDLQAERARRSLPEFVREAWHVVEPATAFKPAFHLDAICEHLEALLSGDIRRLLINVPPRHGKSRLTSVLFPAWAWSSRPELRWLFASYAQSLATRDSLTTRRLIESPWYRERWGHVFELTSDQNLKARFENNRGGVRIATSVGGSATGEGGDLIVVDDAHKIEEAHSAAQRDAVLEWFDSTLSTRLNDPRGGIVVIGQRVHERDLCGHLIAQGGWEHLCLPAEYEPSHPFCWPADPRTEPGQPLWPDHYGPGELADLKRAMGSYAVAGQLQQRPAPAGGGIFKRSWWRWYDPAGPLPAFDQLLQSWDFTFTGGPNSDYVVGQVWGKRDTDRYLLRQFRERVAFTETLDAIREITGWADETFPDHRGHIIVVEEAANGAAVIDTLNREISSIVAQTPKGDKVSRANAVSPQVEAGHIYLPGAPNDHNGGFDRSRTPAWVQDFVAELESFPTSAYDDQVDAMTQALARFHRGTFRVRFLGPERPRRRY